MTSLLGSNSVGYNLLYILNHNNHYSRGVLSENMEFIEALQNLNLLEVSRNSSESLEAATTINPIINDAVKQIGNSIF